MGELPIEYHLVQVLAYWYPLSCPLATYYLFSQHAPLHWGHHISGTHTPLSWYHHGSELPLPLRPLGPTCWIWHSIETHTCLHPWTYLVSSSPSWFSYFCNSYFPHSHLSHLLSYLFTMSMGERDHYITQAELLHPHPDSPPLMIPPPSSSVNTSITELHAQISSPPLSETSETSTAVKSVGNWHSNV